MQNKREFKAGDSRIYLAAMVVCMHFLGYYAVSDMNSLAFAGTLVSRGDMAVAGFFVLSGLVLTNKLMSQDMPVSVFIIERFVRLIPPFAASYVVLWMVYQIGAGTTASYVTNMGYEWGMVWPIGRLEELTVSDAITSFIGQLGGQNDQLLLNAWTMHHELIAIGWLICAVSLARCASYFRHFLFTPAFIVAWLAILLIYRDTYGLIDSFALGVLIALLSRSGVGEMVWRVANVYLVMLAILGGMILYLVTLASTQVGDALTLKLALYMEDSVTIKALVYLLSDMRYFLMALLMALIMPLLGYLSKIYILSDLSRHGSKVAFSIYLVHVPILMLHAYTLHQIKLLDSAYQFDLTVGVAAITYLVLLVPSVALFYIFVERPCHKLSKWLEEKLINTRSSFLKMQPLQLPQKSE